MEIDSIWQDQIEKAKCRISQQRNDNNTNSKALLPVSDMYGGEKFSIFFFIICKMNDEHKYTQKKTINKV